MKTFVLLVLAGLLFGAAPLQVDKRIQVFYPVPAEGCPGGFYEVGGAFFDGLRFHAACWSKELRVVEKVESTVSYGEEVSR